MPPALAGLLPGTLDLLILKAVSLGRLHGYGVLGRALASSARGCSTPSGHVRQQPAREILRADWRRTEGETAWSVSWAPRSRHARRDREDV
jgi:PadR family transcriptional regulator, regulatory protein PadR